MVPRLAAAAFAALLLSGCDTYHFLAGTMSEDARKPVEALAHYRKFLASAPKDPRGCEVRLRAAELERRVFGRCEEARPLYEEAARGSPRQRACVERAKLGLLLCPDYFPLDPGRTWVYVDSASGGKAMRQEWEARASTTPAAGSIVEAIYAGDRRVKAGETRYAKGDWAVWRVEDGGARALLRYPYTEGLAWSVRRKEGGKSYVVESLIVGAPVTVATRAGTFESCLKVREKDGRFKGAWRYDYYCPGVGRVKTTVGGPGYENPNAELLRFGKMNGA